MKKNILKNLSLVFCICLLSAPTSAQVIPDPGIDPLSDSLSTVASMTAHFWKTTVFKNGIINEATHQHNFSLNHTYSIAGEQCNKPESNKKQSNQSNLIPKEDLYFHSTLKRLQTDEAFLFILRTRKRIEPTCRYRTSEYASSKDILFLKVL